MRQRSGSQDVQLERRAVLGLGLGWMAVLTGCGGGTADDPLDTGREALPLRAGDQWHYANTYSVGTMLLDAERDMQVLSQAEEAGGTAYVLSGWRLHSLPDAAVSLLRTPTTLVRRPGADDPAYEQAIGDRVLLRLPLTTGDRWTQVDARVPVVKDGLDDWLLVKAEVAVEDGGPVDLPQGRVRATWRVTTTETQDFESVPPQYADHMRIRLTDTLWIAPGLGMVARSLTIWPAAAIHPYVNGDRLLSWKL